MVAGQGDIMGKAALIARALSNRLESAINWAVIVIAAAMVIIVLAGIISRAGFNAAFHWTEELGRYTMIWAACLGIGLALKRGLHVGIGIIVKRFPRKIGIALDIAARILITIFLVVMTINGIIVCKFVSMQTSPTMGFNMVWVFAITPVTCVLQLIFLALMTIEDLADDYWKQNLVLRKHNIAFYE